MAQRPVDAIRSRLPGQMRVGTPVPLLVALALSLLPAGTWAQSEEDAILIRSELIAPARVPAAEPITITLVLRSDSDEPVSTSARIEVGNRFLFGGLPEASEARFDAAERTLMWEPRIEPRGEARLAFDVMAPGWMSGSGLEVVARASRPQALLGITRRALVEVGESQRMARTPRVRVGPVLVGAAEGILLAALLAAVALGLSLRRRIPKFAAPAAVAAWLLLTVVGLLLLDGIQTLWTDVRILTAWRPTLATVVDAAAVYQPPSSGGPRSRSGRGSYSPLAALRYDAGGGTRVAIGFWSDSHVFVSRRAARLAAQYPPGTTTRCWVDPEDPSRFVLIRTPGLGHLFFALLVGLAVGAARLALRLARSVRGSRGGGGEPAIKTI
jgi:hypothetical protein